MRLSLSFLLCAFAACQETPPDPVRLRLAREVIQASESDLMPARDSATLKVAQDMFPQLIDSLAADYSKHFSTEELRQIRAFYMTPVGKRYVIETDQFVRHIDSTTTKAQRESPQFIDSGAVLALDFHRRYFSTEELRQIDAFLRTPVGKRLRVEEQNTKNILSRWVSQVDSQVVSQAYWAGYLAGITAPWTPTQKMALAHQIQQDRDAARQHTQP